MLTDTPNLQARTIFDVLCERYSDRYTAGQLRTLQRHIRQWHILQGDKKSKNVFFPQRHVPGGAVQGDFTHTGKLSMTIVGQPFRPLLCHNTLPYFGWQWATRCVSEIILSLRCGLQDALFRLQRVPVWYLTDNSTGATHRVGCSRTFDEEYLELTKHLGVKPRTTAVCAKEQNGSIEAHNGSFKRFLQPRLLVRGNRDFADEGQFDQFVAQCLDRANKSRQDKRNEELKVMRTLETFRTP